MPRTHPVAVLGVLALVVACGGFVAYTRSTQGTGSTEKIVDVSKGPAFSERQVVQVFAAHGIALSRTSGHVTGATSFTDVHPESTVDDGFLVTIWTPTSKVHVSTAGPKPRYEKWIGNVDVYYGGLGNTLAARVAAAADALAG